MATEPLALPVPLSSLATDQGQWPWNRPPEYPDPTNFVEEIEKKLELKPEVLEDILDMLLVGATVEDVVNTIAITAFMKGKLSPDGAEIAKIPLSALILDYAIKNNVDAKVFSSLPSDQAEEKALDKLDLIKEFNPRLYEGIQEEINMQEQQLEEGESPSFMKMEE